MKNDDFLPRNEYELCGLFDDLLFMKTEKFLPEADSEYFSKKWLEEENNVLEFGLKNLKNQKNDLVEPQLESIYSPMDSKKNESSGI